MANLELWGDKLGGEGASLLFDAIFTSRTSALCPNFGVAAQKVYIRSAELVLPASLKIWTTVM